jgi:hypothetical protein
MKPKKPLAAIIMAKIGSKKPMEDEKPSMMDESEEMSESGEEYEIAQDVLDAIAKKDKMLLAEALEAAFNYYDAKPHKEGEHMGEEEEE